MGKPGDPRNQRKYKALRAAFLALNPSCALKLAGCTGRADTVEHTVPVAARPDLAFEVGLWLPACLHCNASKGATYGNRRRRKRSVRPRRLIL
ncbi:hypothetical protein [Nocardioides sp.]|uniref:hypothetical protein n=1 Tax=Nocardioides sp. TaxID=35761 RepID=UPI0026274B8F|nr:hypothetical protein [Nocardioides sp.]MDI6912208.1 hypothetical protein [Nocardioides sp.]